VNLKLFILYVPCCCSHQEPEQSEAPHPLHPLLLFPWWRTTVCPDLLLCLPSQYLAINISVTWDCVYCLV
jgi:hypothetical protein